MSDNNFLRITFSVRGHTLIFLLLFSAAARGQDVLGKVSGLFSTHFDSLTRTHYQFFRDSVAILDLSGQFKDGFRVPDLSRRLTDYQPVIVKSEIWMVHRNGGIVYSVSRKGLIRLDKSYEHRMQAGSLIFTRNDTLFRHGGYGFWSARRELIYFNTSSSEWELYAVSSEGEIPPAIFSHFGILSKNRLTVFMGCTIHPKDPLNIVRDPGVWELDFGTKKWSFLGNLDPKKENDPSGVFAGQWGGRLMTFSGKMKVSVIDPQANVTSGYETSPVFLQISRESDLRPVIADGQYYFYRAYDPHNDPKKPEDIELEFCRMPLEQFMIREVERGQFLQNKPDLSSDLMVTAAVGLIALVGVRLWRKKKQKSKRLLKLSGNTLSAGQQEIQLSEQEAALIRLLLDAQGDITTTQILEITSIPGQDHTYNLRMKNQLIEKLNDEMALLLGVETDIITTERSKSDRRIKRYLIQKDFFLS